MYRLLAGALACASLVHAVDLEDHVRKSIPVDSANRLVLKADDGALRIQPGAEKTVEVEVSFRGDPDSRAEFDRLRRNFTLDVARDGSDIRVTGSFHRGFLEFGRGLRNVEYRITVPEKLNAEIATSGGPISVSNLKGKIKASTSGGPIRINETGGDVDASTSGGPITIERNSGRVRARTSGGGIEVREATGAIDASTSGGGVNASLSGQPKEECRLDTSGGNINVSLSKNIHVNLDAAASGGRIWTDFPVRRDDDSEELRTPLNGGGPRLYLRTSGGGIRVRQQP